MSLPKKISPDPLVTSTVEIRFLGSMDSPTFLNNMYRLLGKELPNLQFKGVPIEFKKTQSQFKFLPDFSISNDRFSVSFSENVISFENVQEYPLWDKYFSFIKSVLTTISSRIQPDSIIRIGVRFASVFDQGFHLKEIFNLPLQISYDDYQVKNIQIKNEFVKDNIKLFMQIAERADINKPTKRVSGTLIDIDASTESIEQKKFVDVLDVVDILHTEQKKLFFDMLSPKFLDSLKPEY